MPRERLNIVFGNMTTMNLIDKIKTLAPEDYIMDGFNDCIAGVSYSFSGPDVVVYDAVKVIDKLMMDGMNGTKAIRNRMINIILSPI